MSDSQKWYESRAVWGGIIVVVAMLARAGGYTVDAETQAGVLDYILEGVAALGGLASIWGRIKATKFIE